MKRIILVLFMCLALSSLVLATDYKAIQFNPGDLVNITGVLCTEKDNSACADTVNCSLSVINDSQDFIVSNLTMLVATGGFRNLNVSYAPNYTTTWSAVVSCDNGGLEEFVIEIGEGATDWETAIIMGFIGLVFIFAFMGFFVFVREYWILKSFLYLSSLFALILLINTANLVTIGINTAKIMQTAFMVSIIVSLFFFLYLFIFATKEVFKILRKRKELKWG